MNKIGRWISVGGALAVSALNLCGFSVSADSAIWDGSCDTDWYHNMKREFYIETPEELAGLASLVNSGTTMEGKTIHLMSDMALNDTANYENWLEEPPANVWTAIGTSDNPFYGTFDGNGFTVEGMYISETKSGDYGLFGYSKNASLSDVEIDCGYIMMDSDSDVGELSIGGICGKIAVSTISKCIYQGKTLMNISENYHYAGGICGYANGSVVQNCRNEGTIDLFGDANGYAGGICGNVMWDGLIDNCANYGEIHGNDKSGGICGGFGGDGSEFYLLNSYNRANVASSSSTTETSAGGIIGNVSNARTIYLRNVYNTGSVDTFYAGKLVGEDTWNHHDPCIVRCENCYYLISDILSAIYSEDDTENTVACTQSEMRIEEFAEKLGDVFVYVNGSYPKLLWEVYENGDVNQDGSVNVADIVLLQKYLLASETLSKTAATLADMDEDKCVDGFDLAYLKRAVLAK